MEEYLHNTLIDAATPDMTFEGPYYFMNDLSVKRISLLRNLLGCCSLPISNVLKQSYIVKLRKTP